MKEKRLVTVLYADLAGFTRLTDELGAEATTDFINNCYNVIDSIIHSYGGTVLRHEGDRVMAVFGFPKARGKDSYYGLIAALRVREAAKMFAYPVGVHVGVASGEVIIEGIDLYGPVIEEASHLEALGEAGDICLNRNCCEMNKLLFDHKEVKEGGYQYWKLQSEKTLLQEYQTEYLDRDPEFNQFTGFLNCQEKLIVITGPAGIGKTRFIHESLRALNQNDGYNIHVISFLGSGSSGPYGSIVRVIRTLNADFTLEKTQELSDDRYRLKLYESFTQILFNESRRKPLILVFQSIDLIDTDSLEYLKYLVNNMQSHALTLVIETRSRSRQVLDALSTSAAAPPKMVTLQPLSSDHAKQIVDSLTEKIELPSELAQRVIELSQGNPLYLEESCHYILHEFHLGKNPRQIVLPFRLRELAGYIIDTIPANYLWGLSIFSVYGYEINKKILRLLLPDYNEFVKFCMNDNLIQLDSDRVFFKTPIIRDELYARLSKEMRQKFHGEVAKALEQNMPLVDSTGLIAYHFQKAGHNEKAFVFTVQWAHYLEDTHMTQQAIEAYSTALTLAESVEPARTFELLLKKANLLNRMGDREGEREAVKRLIALADGSGSAEQRYAARQAMGFYHDSIADYAPAIIIYESLLQEEETPFVLQRLGLIHYNQGKLRESGELFTRMLQRAQAIVDSKLEATAYEKLGVVSQRLGEVDKALENYHRAKALFERNGDTVSLGYLTAEFGNLYFDLSRYHDARAMYNEALKIAIMIGDEVFKAEMLRKLGNVSYTLGDYDQELAYLSQALEINKKIQNRRGEGDVYHNMGITLTDLGYYEKALEHFNVALKIDEEIKHLEGVALHLGDMADCYIGIGKFDDAQVNLEKCLKILEQLRIKNHLAFYYNHYARILHLLGQSEMAKKMSEKSIAFAIESKYAGCEVLGLSNYAAICLDTGDRNKALELSVKATSKLQRLAELEGSRAAVFYTHYRILSALDQNGDADQYLEKAYQDIKSKGDRIKDPNYKMNYFAIKENHEVLMQWERSKKPR
ncbi:MAG TPA: tetratricopeptide repeat protein [bacterium]